MRSRHLLIGYQGASGKQGTTLRFGLKTKGVDVWRVPEIHIPVPF